MVTVFQPRAHLVPNSVDRVKVSKVLREWERYELEKTEKKKQITSLTFSSYMVSVDPGLLT